MSNPSDSIKIRIENISKSFHNEDGDLIVNALQDVSLDISDHTFVSFLGPSGCGKTTLLRMIAGIEKPTSGKVFHKGKSVTGINTDVSYVPQGKGLFPWMTLYQNIDLALKLKGAQETERRDVVAYWIDKVGLEGFENSFPWQLSGGMEKRGALARALISDCEVVLMDEPFGPLDAQTRLILQNDLLKLWSDNQSIVVFVTHDLVEAVALSDVIVIFSRRPGRIKQINIVDIPRPRDVFEIFHEPRFTEIYDEVRAALQDEILITA